MALAWHDEVAIDVGRDGGRHHRHNRRLELVDSIANYVITIHNSSSSLPRCWLVGHLSSLVVAMIVVLLVVLLTADGGRVGGHRVVSLIRSLVIHGK